MLHPAAVDLGNGVTLLNAGQRLSSSPITAWPTPPGGWRSWAH